MKGNESKILLGSLVIAVLIVLAAYKFFYSSDIEEADRVQNEINSYQSRLNELNEKNANRSMYESGIAESQDIIDTVLSLYGPGNTAEKTIMMIVDLCHKTGISVSDITFNANKLVYSSDAAEGETPEIQVYKSGLAIHVSSGYTQFKKLMDYINSHPERMNVENFNTLFASDSGRLDTTVNVNLYGVIDKNHTYVAPVIEDIELGSTNIFKTMEVYNPEEELAEGTETQNTAPIENTENSGSGETLPEA